MFTCLSVCLSVFRTGEIVLAEDRSFVPRIQVKWLTESVTSALEYLMPSSGLHKHLKFTHRYPHTGTHIHTIKTRIEFEFFFLLLSHFFLVGWEREVVDGGQATPLNLQSRFVVLVESNSLCKPRLAFNSRQASCLSFPSSESTGVNQDA